MKIKEELNWDDLEEHDPQSGYESYQSGYDSEGGGTPSCKRQLEDVPQPKRHCVPS